MNLLAAAGSRNEASVFPRLAETVETLYGEPLRELGLGGGDPRLGTLEDGGIVVGRAGGGEAELALLGGLHYPLPGWEGGRPTDDPHEAARWLLERYRSSDAAFLDGVHGQFAVLVSDRAGGRLLAACDPGGVRSLFAYEGEDGPVVCSNLFVLARALRHRVRPERSLEDFLLVYGFLPWGRTAFEGITTLAPGRVHVWEKGRRTTRPIADDESWLERYPALRDPDAPRDEALDQLYDAFMAATDEQAGSAGDAAVLLGGVDSALVAAALHRLGKRVHTYSFHYDEPGFDQPHTDTLARHIGARHEWVRITPEVMREGLERFGLVFSRPTNWPNYVIQTAHVCRVIRGRGLLHVHSGDGADQTLMGYPRTHSLARLYHRMPRLPDGLARGAARVVGRGWAERLLGRPYRVGMNVLRHLARPRHQRGFLSFRVFDESSLPRLRPTDPPPDQEAIHEVVEALARPWRDASPARRAYAGKAAASANKSKLGGSSDHAGVIIHAPYLHPGFKALAGSLPDHMLRPGDQEETAVLGKHALLRMAERKEMLPREVLYQPKVAAVDAPVDAWYEGPLRDDLRSLFAHLPFRADSGYLERLLVPTLAARLHRRYLSTDHLTSHEASLLASYAALMRALE